MEKPNKTTKDAMPPLELSEKSRKYWKLYLHNEAVNIVELLAFYGSKSHWRGDVEDLMKRATAWERKRKAAGL